MTISINFPIWELHLSFETDRVEKLLSCFILLACYGIRGFPSSLVKTPTHPKNPSLHLSGCFIHNLTSLLFLIFSVSTFNKLCWEFVSNLCESVCAHAFVCVCLCASVCVCLPAPVCGHSEECSKAAFHSKSKGHTQHCVMNWVPQNLICSLQNLMDGVHAVPGGKELAFSGRGWEGRRKWRRGSSEQETTILLICCSSPTLIGENKEKSLNQTAPLLWWKMKRWNDQRHPRHPLPFCQYSFLSSLFAL